MLYVILRATCQNELSVIGYLSGRTDKSDMKPTPIVYFRGSYRFHTSFPLHIIYHIFNMSPIGTTPYFWFFNTLVSMYFNFDSLPGVGMISG